MDATAVVKVGGSLLEPPDLPELPGQLEEVLRELGGERPIVVVGGGQTVDIFRRWDRLFGLGEEFSHWAAVRALTLNSLVAARMLPGAIRVESETALSSAWRERRIPVLDAYRFLRDVDEKRPDPLPRRWTVTTDSIAARVAVHHSAPTLILLKSLTLPDGLEIAAAVRLGFVDPYFEEAARGIPAITAINLRLRTGALASIRLVPKAPERSTRT